MIHIRIPQGNYASIGYTIEKLGTGTYFDGSKFVSAPPDPIPLTAGTGIYASVFAADISTTDIAVFDKNELAIYFHMLPSKMVTSIALVDYNPTELSVPIVVLGVAAGRPVQ